MKCKYLFLLSAIALAACGNEFEFDNTKIHDETVAANAEAMLGVTIDPNHNWTAIEGGSITITADAPLDDIAKVQVLTASPFGNDEAEVLNSIDCQKGDVVTLSYEAPIDLTTLVAACVSSKGVYYIKVFNNGDSNVSFSSTRALTRASGDDYPTAIVLGTAMESFNAQRASISMKSVYKNVMISDGGQKYYYDVWNDGSWINDRLWFHESVHGGSGWIIDDGTIYRNVTTTGDLATVAEICNTYLKKKGNNNGPTGKSNNWKDLIKGTPYFSLNNNYLESTGTPITLIPLQMNTTEGSHNYIYYYYFDPAWTKGMTSEQEVNFIKSLPKYKAISGWNGNETFARTKEYLLPYYGDYAPTAGDMAISNAIPKGYKIGFMNRKNFNRDATNNKSGCTYGDGRLNVEVNHLIGHYFTPVDKNVKQTVARTEDGSTTETKSGLSANGFQWDSPRLAILSANNTTYLCFEDGSDLNFCDMIVEVCRGTEIIEEAMIPDVTGAAYLMCFEDRPESADYDMNDVVLYAERIDNSTIAIGVLACGANDAVVLHGVEGAAHLNGNEIHRILGIPDESFLNTVVGQPTMPVQTYNVSTTKSIEEYLRGISIENQTTGKTFKMPERGKSPYIIIVPHNFKYPKEGQSIKAAYPGFLEWASNMNAKRDWYRAGQAELIFTGLFY